MKIVSRSILILMLLGAAYVLAFGPRPEPALPGDRQHDVVIQYWEKWTHEEAEAMHQIVDDFNSTVGRQKHIYVEMLSLSKVDQKTLISTAGGVPPDVAGLWDFSVVQYGILGALEPLEDLAAAHGIKEGYYKKVYWDACQCNGHLYALISTPAATALIYNKRIFHDHAAELRAAGLDPDRPPATIDELTRYSVALTEFKTDASGNKHMICCGYMPMSPQYDYYVLSLPNWFGSDIWDDKAHRFTLTTPGMLAAFDWFQSFPRRWGVRAASEFASTQGGIETPQNPFMLGTLAMEMQGPWMAKYIHNINPAMDNDWAVAAFPSVSPELKDVTFCPFDTLVIPRGCAHKNEAFEFIAFVNQQPEMEKLCMLHGKNSPLKNVSQNFLSHHPNRYIDVFERLSSSPNAHATMQCPIAAEAGAELAAIMQGTLVLEVDPKVALPQAQERLQAKYDQFEATLKRRLGIQP